MTKPPRSNRKKKLTIAASEQGVEIATKALIRLGFNSKNNFSKTKIISRNTVTKFFNQQHIQLDTFKKRCQELKLNWREISGITEENQTRSKIKDSNHIEINERKK